MLTLQIKEKEIENLTPEEEFVRGTVGAKCQINFDEFWQGYEKYIVFKRVGYEPINLMVDSLENEIEIPYTILAEIGEFKIGVFGITETETLPTLYSKDIKILYGTDTHGTTPPTYTPSEIDQLRLSKQDKLTAGNGIKIENNVISSSGTIDYELLENKPQINGVELLGNKSLTDLGIDIPTKTSELENDSGFIDDTAFENYYTKTEVDEKTVVDQTYNPDSENAQSGKAISEAVSPIRQTITVDTPVWTVQPTIEGPLNEAFEIWSIRPYFVTLKNTDGTDLESGRFKLCKTLDGYASAIEQIFTLNDTSVALSENLPVDFKSISSDRTSFEMRNAGVFSIKINTKNLKSQRYIFSAFHSLIVKSGDAKYIYLKDSVGKKLGTDPTYYSPVGRYSGNNGFLLPICNSNVTDTCILGYVIKANRTKKGFVDSLTGLRFFNAKQEAISQYAFSYVSNRIDDFQQEDLSYFTFASNNRYYFGNGTVITLEEFA